MLHELVCSCFLLKPSPFPENMTSALFYLPTLSPTINPIIITSSSNSLSLKMFGHCSNNSMFLFSSQTIPFPNKHDLCTFSIFPHLSPQLTLSFPLSHPIHCPENHRTLHIYPPYTTDLPCRPHFFFFQKLKKIISNVFLSYLDSA